MLELKTVTGHRLAKNCRCRMPFKEETMNRWLRFSLLLVLLGTFILPASSTSFAHASPLLGAGCDDLCWQSCPTVYFSCLSDGDGAGTCCARGNFCAHSCGDDCALFCAE